jgi:hypothetical protein
MAQEIYLRLSELAHKLVMYGKELVFLEPYQCASEISAVEQNVIQIDYHKLPHLIFIHRAQQL